MNDRIDSAPPRTVRLKPYRSDAAREPTVLTTAPSDSRARIVGDRSGLIADFVVFLVRFSHAAVRTCRLIIGRISAAVTPLGWVMLGLAPTGLVVGYSVGWVELVAVGFASLAVVIIASFHLIGRNAFTVELSLPQTRVVAGHRACGVISAHNPVRRQLPGVKVEISVGTGIAEVVLPGLDAGDNFTHDFALPTDHRGVVTIGPVRTIRSDPIGLLRRELLLVASTDLFVHPRTIAIPSMSSGFIRDLEGNPARGLSNSDVSFHALREYVPGDERRYIHWKSTAKTGRYMIRQFEETRRSHLVIALSLSTSDYGTEAEFEMAVSVAGSLGTRAIRDARDISVVVGEETPEFARHKIFAVRRLNVLTRSRLLDDLALVAHSHSALGVFNVARGAAEDIAGVSLAFLICGSLTTPTELRRASTQFPPGVEVVAVLCNPEKVPGLRRIAGLSVLTIGYLEDLRKSLARSAAV